MQISARKFHFEKQWVKKIETKKIKRLLAPNEKDSTFATAF